MSFEMPQGTHGARQPKAGLLTKLFNNWSMSRIRRSDGKVMGMDVLVLQTVGRKTGEERTTPLAWFPGTGGSWLVVASAAGAANNPAWYLNVAANPDKVKVELPGRVIPVCVEELHGSERNAAWQQIVASLPRFSKYRDHTDRQFPILRLTPK